MGSACVLFFWLNRKHGERSSTENTERSSTITADSKASTTITIMHFWSFVPLVCGLKSECFYNGLFTHLPVRPSVLTKAQVNSQRQGSAHRADPKDKFCEPSSPAQHHPRAGKDAHSKAFDALRQL